MGARNWFLCRRVRLAAERFPLPAELTLEAIVGQAQLLTGHPAMFATVPMEPHAPSGRVDRMRIEGEVLDLVQVPQDADPAHQEAIALHEIAHLALGHVMAPVRGVDVSRLPLLAEVYGEEALAAAFEVEGSHLRGCDACDQRQEADAEYFARRLSARIALARRPHAVPGSSEAAKQLAERVDKTFGVE